MQEDEILEAQNDKGLNAESEGQESEPNQETTESILEDILGESEPKVQEDEAEEADSEPVKPEAEEEPKELLIDDSLIEQYPTLAGLKGKPLIEVAKSYDNLEREYSKTKNELAEALKKQKDEVEEAELEQQDEMPDPYDDPEGFRKWIEGQTTKEPVDIQKLIDEKLQEVKAKEEEERLKAEKLKADSEKFQNYVLSEITKGIPGSNAGKLIDAYIDANKSELLENGQMKPEIQAAFAKNPDLLVKNVVNFAKLNDNSLTRAEAYEIARDGLRKKPTGNLTHKSVAYSAEGLSEDDLLVQQIIDLNSGQND